MYKFGDIVLIAFPFTDGYGVKKRPALVILDTGDHDVLLARITSQHVNTDFDVQVAAWEDAGLLTRSYVRLHGAHKLLNRTLMLLICADKYKNQRKSEKSAQSAFHPALVVPTTYTAL